MPPLRGSAFPGRAFDDTLSIGDVGSRKDLYVNRVVSENSRRGDCRSQSFQVPSTGLVKPEDPFVKIQFLATETHS